MFFLNKFISCLDLVCQILIDTSIPSNWCVFSFALEGLFPDYAACMFLCVWALLWTVTADVLGKGNPGQRRWYTLESHHYKDRLTSVRFGLTMVTCQTLWDHMSFQATFDTEALHTVVSCYNRFVGCRAMFCFQGSPFWIILGNQQGGKVTGFWNLVCRSAVLFWSSEGFWRILLLWRYSRPAWTRSCAACCRWPCFGRGVGLDDPQRSLPTLNILWFCEVDVLAC